MNKWSFRSGGRRYLPHLAIIPFVAIIGTLFLLPAFRIISSSFLTPSFGLTNYETIFDNALYREVFLRTFSMSLFVTIISVIISLPIANYLVKCGPLMKALLFAIVLVPL